MATDAASIPTNLRDLLTKLEFLAMLKSNMKPCMNDMTFVDSKSWSGALHRKFLREDKRSLMTHLEQIIEQTIRAMNEYKNTQYFGIIVNALSSAKIGLINLLTTYQDYPNTVAQIKVYLTNIDLQLDKYRQFIHKDPHNISATPSEHLKLAPIGGNTSVSEPLVGGEKKEKQIPPASLMKGPL